MTNELKKGSLEMLVLALLEEFHKNTGSTIVGTDAINAHFSSTNRARCLVPNNATGGLVDGTGDGGLCTDDGDCAGVGVGGADGFCATDLITPIGAGL